MDLACGMSSERGLLSIACFGCRISKSNQLKTMLCEQCFRTVGDSHLLR